MIYESGEICRTRQDETRLRRQWGIVDRLTPVQCAFSIFEKDMAAALLAWLSEGKIPIPERRTPVQLIVRSSSSSL